MDNVTHGLIGLLVAEVAVVLRYGGKTLGPPGFRGAAAVCSIAANNTPDLDFVYSGITEGKLGYLLHHRGHTHTLAAAIPMALLALLPVLVWARRRSPPFSRADWLWLAGLALLGPVLHVGMDGLNNYGVHPFWPIHNGWFHGDTAFIVEPTFLLTLGILLGYEARTRTGKGVLWGVALLVLGLGWAMDVMLWPWAVGLTVLAGAGWLGARRLGRPQRVMVAAGIFLGCIVTFAGSRLLMARHLEGELAQRTPQARTYDLVLTPAPANPLCWTFLAVQTEGADYVARRGRASLLPSLLAAERCPARAEEGTTAPLAPVTALSDSSVTFRGEFRMPLAELRALSQGHCGVAALLRFTRVPYVAEARGESFVAGDLRYDNEPGLGFAEVEFPREPQECPRAVPPWRAPRADLL